VDPGIIGARTDAASLRALAAADRIAKGRPEAEEHLAKLRDAIGPATLWGGDTVGYAQMVSELLALCLETLAERKK
jgi:hypothetical protein